MVKTQQTVAKVDTAPARRHGDSSCRCSIPAASTGPVESSCSLSPWPWFAGIVTYSPQPLQLQPLTTRPCASASARLPRHVRRARRALPCFTPQPRPVPLVEIQSSLRLDFYLAVAIRLPSVSPRAPLDSAFRCDIVAYAEHSGT